MRCVGRKSALVVPFLPMTNGRGDASGMEAVGNKQESSSNFVGNAVDHCVLMTGGGADGSCSCSNKTGLCGSKRDGYDNQWWVSILLMLAGGTFHCKHQHTAKTKCRSTWWWKAGHESD